MSFEQSVDGVASSSSSRHRQRQMLMRHLSARRGSRPSCGERSQYLQANLYKFLRKCPSSVMDSSPRDERGGTPSIDQPQRRDVLLKAIRSLQKISASAPAGSLVSGSNANSCATATQQEQQPVDSRQITEQAQHLQDHLRYLALACNPAISRARTGRASDDCAGNEIVQRIATARRKLNRLLRQLSSIDSGCCKVGSEAQADQCKDPLFWCFPATEAEAGKPALRHQCSQKQKQQRRRRRRQTDPVAQQVARSKALLLGDPVFQVSCAGQEYRWGRMTLPTASGGPNAADRLGRENLHRHRLAQHREAIRAELDDFANRLEDTWEAIEESRMDRAIDAACKRLQIALRRRPKRKAKCLASEHRQKASPMPNTALCEAAFKPLSKERRPTMSMMDAAAEGTSNCHQAEEHSVEWGV